MKKFTAIIIAAAFTLFAFAGHAEAQTKPATKEIQQFEKAGGKVIYLGKSYDVDGWLLVKRNGEPHTILYMTPAGAMLRGRLFSPGGKDITKTQLQIYNGRSQGTQDAIDIGEQADKDAVPIGEQFYAALANSEWIRAGVSDAPYIYMLVNINCEHCQTLWRTFKGSVEKGQLQVRIVPVGTEEGNLNAGAAMFSVENPAQAWQEFMDGKKGSLDRTLIKGNALERMAKNNKMVKAWKPPQIPMTVYRKVTDGTVMVVPGQPANPMSIIMDINKLKEE